MFTEPNIKESHDCLNKAEKRQFGLNNEEILTYLFQRESDYQVYSYFINP